jgi:phospholipase/lecithinase/hemolysin
MLSPFVRATRSSLVKTSRIGAIALAAILVAACGSDEADSPRLFSSAVVFGASLTDTGNCGSANAGACPPTPPYATGRASNGTLFIETIAGRYGAATTPSSRGGNNFAYGGARTGAIPGLTAQSTIPSMVAQVQQFIERPASAALLNPQTLFVVDASTFGNNFNAAAGAGLLPGGSTALVTAAVTDIVTIMTRLYSAGGRNILLINVPNLGFTPLVRAQGATAQAGATQLAGGFNQALAGQVTLLVSNSPGLRVYTIDLFGLSNAITANPGAAGLNNVTDACVTTAVCATPDTYLYWDTFHPTRAAGAYIANQPTTPPLPAP